MTATKNLTDSPNIARLLAAVEPMQREAYVRGWKDAMAAVTAAADTLLTPPEPPTEIATIKGSGPTPALNSNLAKVWAVVQAQPGLNGAELARVVRQHGHEIGAESVRTCLFRLRRRQLIEQRDGKKWFPVSTGSAEVWKSIA